MHPSFPLKHGAIDTHRLVHTRLQEDLTPATRPTTGLHLSIPSQAHLPSGQLVLLRPAIPDVRIHHSQNSSRSQYTYYQSQFIPSGEEPARGFSGTQFQPPFHRPLGPVFTPVQSNVARPSFTQDLGPLRLVYHVMPAAFHPMIRPPVPPWFGPIPIRSWTPTDPGPFIPHLVGGARLTRDQWLTGARARKQGYSSTTRHHHHPYSPIPPIHWVLVEPNDTIPMDALQTGVEATGEALFSVRAWFNGGLHLGKGGRHLSHRASISYGSRELPMAFFEVLVGDEARVQWIAYPRTSSKQLSPTSMPSSGPISPLLLPALASPASLPTFIAPTFISRDSPPPGGPDLSRVAPRVRPFIPVEGGFEPVRLPSSPSTPASGRILEKRLLLIAQAPYAAGWHPGKVEVGDDHCCVGFAGGEVWIKEFRVMAWA